MGRHLVRAALFMVLAFAVLVVLVFGPAIIFGGDSMTRVIGVVLTLVGLAIGYAAVGGLSRRPPPGWEEKHRAKLAAENRPPRRHQRRDRDRRSRSAVTRCGAAPHPRRVPGDPPAANGGPPLGRGRADLRR